MSTTIPIHSTATARRRVMRKGIASTAALLKALPQTVTADQFRAEFGIDDAKDDLDAIPDGIRSGAFAFLHAYRDGSRYRVAIDRVGLRPCDISTARRRSKVFRDAHDMVREALAEERAIMLEEKLVALATGEVERRKRYLDPDVRALQSYLGANDAKHKPGAAAPVTAISISLSV